MALKQVFSFVQVLKNDKSYINHSSNLCSKIKGGLTKCSYFKNHQKEHVVLALIEGSKNEKSRASSRLTRRHFELVAKGFQRLVFLVISKVFFILFYRRIKDCFYYSLVIPIPASDLFEVLLSLFSSFSVHFSFLADGVTWAIICL